MKRMLGANPEVKAQQMGRLGSFKDEGLQATCDEFGISQNIERMVLRALSSKKV